MTGRRQLWTGIALFLLSFAVPALVVAPIRPGAGLEAATLVATALLLTLCASRALLVPVLASAAPSVTGPTATTAAVPTRLTPDAPGRPRQPRAPNRATVARPC
jgi:hypothetical protein